MILTNQFKLVGSPWNVITSRISFLMQSWTFSAICIELEIIKDNLSSFSSYLQLGNYNSFEGVLYCRPHFDQLFKRTGSLDKSFEGKNKEKLIWSQCCTSHSFSFRIPTDLLAFNFLSRDTKNCKTRETCWWGGKKKFPLYSWHLDAFLCLSIESWTPLFCSITMICFEQKPISTKVSTMFAGTRDKCFGCKNTVYPTEKVKTATFQKHPTH